MNHAIPWLRSACWWAMPLALLVLVMACGGSALPGMGPTTGDGNVPPVPDTASKARCDLLEAGQAMNTDQRARMIEVRQRILGSANVSAATGAVRADRVVLSWLGNTGFAAAFNGHLVLLDAYMRDETGYLPMDNCDLTDLRPELVFIGHGHGDHAAEAPTVLNRNRGAKLVGAAEHCTDVMAALEGITVPRCVEAIPRAAAMGTTRVLDDLIPGVRITAVRHLHSGSGSLPEPTDPPISAVPDPTTPQPVGIGPCRMNCPNDPHRVAAVTVEDGTISVLYQFRVGDFSLLWNNTNGPNQPGDAVLTALAALPPTDVEIGSIATFNQVTVGFRDSRVLIDAVRPRLFSPIHHDETPTMLQGRSYEAGFLEELSNIPVERRPGVQFISDPEDYLNPAAFTFDPSAAVWAGTGPLAWSAVRPN